MSAIKQNNLNVIEIKETKEVTIKISVIKETVIKRDEDNKVTAIEIAWVEWIV